MLLIRDVRVFDGVRLLEADTVLVEGDRIAGVGQWADLHRGESEAEVLLRVRTVEPPCYLG